MRMTLAAATIAAMFMQAQPPPVTPAPVAVLASGAAEGALIALRQDVPASTYQFDTSQGIARRLSGGEAPDVLIAQSSTIDQTIAGGSAVRDSRATIGRVPIGVAMGRQATRPDLTSVNTLKAAILNASTIVISQGASGAFLEKAFADLGVMDQIKDRIVRQPRGDEVMRRLGTGSGNEIGFTMASEIKFGERHGATYVGLLPAAIQNYTQYDAVVMTAAKNPTAARAFVNAITGPAAKKVLAAHGWE